MPSLDSILKRQPPTVSKIIAELNKKRPESDVFLTTQQLADRINVARQTLRVHATAFELAQYRQTIGTQVYWGSPKDIKALRERLNG